ncbi:MAG: hypothetical protein ACFFFC_10680 [Candidatus Thorarchaeota archaeon]
MSVGLSNARLSNSNMPSKSSLVIATIVFPDDSSETNVLLLLESIRAFAGSLSEVEIWCYTPESEDEISSKIRTRIDEMGVELIPFDMDSEISSFPFMKHAHAATIAESRSKGSFELVAWLAPNTLVLQEPSKFILERHISLGYRPVHHKLLGLNYDDPLDTFWSAVYEFCGVSEESVFAMKTQVEELSIRPYFNAGCLVVRPDRTLLQTWRDVFVRVYREPVFNRLYREDDRYAIFVHQAILTGVILAKTEHDEIEELPAKYNYPLNLYFEDITNNRPEYLEECVTIRHEGFHKDPEWKSKMPARKALKEWIANVIR